MSILIFARNIPFYSGDYVEIASAGETEKADSCNYAEVGAVCVIRSLRPRRRALRCRTGLLLR